MLLSVTFCLYASECSAWQIVAKNENTLVRCGNGNKTGIPVYSKHFCKEIGFYNPKFLSILIHGLFVLSKLS